MKPDIQNRADIEKLINLFYEKVKKDPSIGYFFHEVSKVNWDKHLPVMYAFWENVLFYTGGFEGNPMKKHQDIHSRSPISKEQFEHWVRLFHFTIDEHFMGPKATELKQKSESIAGIMQIKIDL
jgi:hemoglobin